MTQNLIYPYSLTSKRAHYGILIVPSHCNDESAEPFSSTKAIFDIIGTFDTVQP